MKLIGLKSVGTSRNMFEITNELPLKPLLSPGMSLVTNRHEMINSELRQKINTRQKHDNLTIL